MSTKQELLSELLTVAHKTSLWQLGLIMSKLKNHREFSALSMIAEIKELESLGGAEKQIIELEKKLMSQASQRTMETLIKFFIH